MKKDYLYEIKYYDGREKHLHIEGNITCEYSDVWQAVNDIAIEKMLEEGAVCPIIINQVTITRIH
jgi:hypothetical protein